MAKAPATTRTKAAAQTMSFSLIEERDIFPKARPRPRAARVTAPPTTPRVHSVFSVCLISKGLPFAIDQHCIEGCPSSPLDEERVEQTVAPRTLDALSMGK